MDTSDPEITFGEDGVCSHCRLYDETAAKEIHAGTEGKRRLQRIAGEIMEEGKGKEYDCIIGVSGGVDSTYVAYVVKGLGLRPLAVHLDNGWDSELAVKNIENALKILGIDLYTHVIDWDEFKDLQLAFLRASTPDSEIPSDHAILALMHRTAARYGTRYVLPGFNTRTESHLPKEWSQGHTDWRYIKSVHKRFGRRKLKTFPHMNFFRYCRYLTTQRWIKVLNYVDYVKKDAVKVLESELGWKYYGWKHYESIYTRFYQGYILPKKFGYDKRRMHLSSLICSGEITREEALAELENDPYPVDLQEEDKAYIIKKFGLTEKEFADIMALPPKRYGDYPTNAVYSDNFLFRCLKTGYGAFRQKPARAPG